MKSIPPSTGGRLLDIGCGFGGLSAFVGDRIGAQEICGVDIDERVVSEAQGKGVDVRIVDAGVEPLPYPDDYFDVVMTLGMMDYLVYFDGIIREINRVLAPGGTVLVSLPNLGSWHTRMGLLMGYQPRDVEISGEVLVGAPRRYRFGPAGHIHVPTVRAFKELMDHHGFRTLRVTGGCPQSIPVSLPLSLADAVLTRRAALARRFYYIGVKERMVPPPDTTVETPYQALGG